MNAPNLTRKDFQTDQDVRWCPGCGDYAILAALQKVLPERGKRKEDLAVISGIGCSSRLSYYVDSYGFHTIHGRALCFATGLKAANQELEVWVISGDGDSLSIGGNHLIHLLRRNVDVNFLLFDNRIYGLTKGQYSPTSEVGKRTKSTPFGSVDRPFNPLSLALGAGGTFIARSVDVFTPHLKQTLTEANAHRGTSFVHIFQNCNIFNDGAFDSFREKENRSDNTLVLEHGKPLIFGKDRDRGIRLGDGMRAEIVKLGNGIEESDLLIHDEQGSIAYLALLAQLEAPEFPVPIGVFRRVERPVFDEDMRHQASEVLEKKGAGDLAQALAAGNTWTIE